MSYLCFGVVAALGACAFLPYLWAYWAVWNSVQTLCTLTQIKLQGYTGCTFVTNERVTTNMYVRFPAHSLCLGDVHMLALFQIISSPTKASLTSTFQHYHRFFVKPCSAIDRV